jgi:hypothetical protein
MCSAARYAYAAAPLPLPLPHVIQNLFRLVGQTESVSMHFLHNKPWRGSGLFHLLGHELDRIQGIT